VLWIETNMPKMNWSRFLEVVFLGKFGQKSFASPKICLLHTYAMGNSVASSWSLWINNVFCSCYLLMSWNVVLQCITLCHITLILACFSNLCACFTCSSAHASTLHLLQGFSTFFCSWPTKLVRNGVDQFFLLMAH